jgi:hypothetical protein
MPTPTPTIPGNPDYLPPETKAALYGRAHFVQDHRTRFMAQSKTAGDWTGAAPTVKGVHYRDKLDTAWACGASAGGLFRLHPHYTARLLQIVIQLDDIRDYTVALVQDFGGADLTTELRVSSAKSIMFLPEGKYLYMRPSDRITVETTGVTAASHVVIAYELEG